VQEINSELERIQAAQVDFLARDGQTPNAMNATLDMNNQRLINLPPPASPTDPVRSIDLPNFIAEGNDLILITREESIVLTAGQTVITLTEFTTTQTAYYISGQSVDQGRLISNTDYIVNSTTQITLTDSYPVGTRLTAVQNEGVEAVVSDIQTFNDIAEMKQATLGVGDTALCKRYYAGGALVNGLLFVIVAGATGTDDGGSFHDLANGNQAQLAELFNSKPVPREVFDTTQNWIDYCVANSHTGASNTLFAQENTWTVNTSGANFTTVTQAIDFLYSANVAYRAISSSGNNARQIINLETGYSFNEQVWYENKDLSFIELTSTDTEVPIIRSALTRGVGNAVVRYMAFTFRFSCQSPIINVLFSMDSSGTATNRGGIRLEANSYGYISTGKGIKNVAERGLHLVNSKAWANDTKWSGAGQRGIRVGNVSTIWAEGADCTGAGESGIAIDAGCVANVRRIDCSNSVAIGLLAIGAHVDAEDMVANDCGTIGVSLEGGAILNMEQGEVLRSGTIGLSAADGSIINAKLSNISSSVGTNVSLRNGTRADLHNATIINAGGAGHNIQLQSGSFADASAVTATGAADRGANIDASEINLVGANISGSGGAADLRMQRGAIVRFGSGTGSTPTLNTITADGIVFG
jgi:hypothetical protein